MSTTEERADANMFLDRHGRAVKKPMNALVGWRPSGYAMIIREDRVLMVLTTWGNQWELPGGGMEPHESIADGIAREVLEETGYRARVQPDLLYFGEERFYDESCGFCHALIMICPAVLLDDEQELSKINHPSVNPNEIARVEWLPLASLTAVNCHRIIWPAIREAKKTL